VTKTHSVALEGQINFFSDEGLGYSSLTNRVAAKYNCLLARLTPFTASLPKLPGRHPAIDSLGQPEIE
jgi:hypothetical protein